MEKLLEIAMKYSDQAEVYYECSNTSQLHFENKSVTEVDGKIQSGYCLRIIKDKAIGTSFTKNLLDREKIVESAMNSLKGGVSADFSFPEPASFEKMDLYNSAVLDITGATVIDEMERIKKLVSEEAKGQLDISSGYGKYDIRIINSNGLDVEQKRSFYSISVELLFPNTYASIGKIMISDTFKLFSDEFIDFIIDRYNKALPEITIPAGKMKVLFDPSVIYALMWRLEAAASAKAVYQGISPLGESLNKGVFSDKLTIYDNPHDKEALEPRAFDDEGVPTQRLVVVENGVFKSFYNNLDYSAKLNTKPTGTGYKKEMWGGDTVSIKPLPNLMNLEIEPGSHSLEELMAGIDKGVLIEGVLGAHSGNITNGDFSVGLNPGLYIENGIIKGRVVDGMVSGNIYNVLKNVVSIENRLHQTFSGRFPAVLIDDISVSVKQ